MSAKETRHEIIEMLFRTKNSAVLEYIKNIVAQLNAQENQEEVLPQEVLDLIERSTADFEAGRYSDAAAFKAERKQWLSEGFKNQ